ncbi:MAG: aldolase/citrate lyase family protein [Pseudomonadota bacterium]
MTLRQRILAGERLVGTWIKTPSPIVCEVLSDTALDLLTLDAEHAPFDRGTLDQCLHACRAGKKPCLVRVPAVGDILNALDCGADGVVVPHIDSVIAAEAMARACRYGRGGRGYAGSSRAAGYGTRPIAEHLPQSNDNTVAIAQIEDVEALDAIDDIAAVDGIDCLFVGRIDLTVALGASSPKDAIVIDAVEAICAAGQRSARPIGMFVGDLDELAHWQSKGATVFILQSEHAFLRAGAQRLADTVRRNN